MKTPKETIPRESSKLFLAVETNEVALDSYAQLNKSRITLSGVVKLKREIVIDILELKEIASTASNHPLQKTRL